MGWFFGHRQISKELSLIGLLKIGNLDGVLGTDIKSGFAAERPSVVAADR
jgi:hypothetical protein